MSWNLSRVINNLEVEMKNDGMKHTATSDLLMASHDIININLVKTEDVETSKHYLVNDELDKLDDFDPSTLQVTTTLGNLKIDLKNITNTKYDPTELTRINFNDTDINFICNNFTVNDENIITPGSNVVKNPMNADLNCSDYNLTHVGTINGIDIGTINSKLNITMTKTTYIDEN